MTIVCTGDPGIISYANDPSSGSAAWGVVNVVANQNALAGIVAGLGENEPLCLCAHGNNSSIGDAGPDGLGWTYTQIASILAANAPNLGVVLIYACASSVANFSAALAVQLESLMQLDGLWCYGWNTPVTIGTPYPAPQSLASKVFLQGTQVNY